MSRLKGEAPLSPPPESFNPERSTKERACGGRSQVQHPGACGAFLLSFRAMTCFELRSWAFPNHTFFLTPPHALLDFLVPVPGLRIVMRNYRSLGLLAPHHAAPHLSPLGLPQPSVSAPDCSCLLLTQTQKSAGVSS